MTIEGQPEDSVLHEIAATMATIAEQGTVLVETNLATVEATTEATKKEGSRTRRTIRWVIAVLVVVILILGVLTSVAWSSRNINKSNNSIAKSNQAILDSLDKNQQGVTEIVEYLHHVQSQGDAGKIIISILCATSDPVTVAACAQLPK